MIYQYVVTLKNDKGRTIDAISLLLAVLSMAVFLVQLIESSGQSFLFGGSILLITIGLLWIFSQRRRTRKSVSYSRILLVTGVTWLAVPSAAWVALPVVLLALLERPAKLPLEIGFTSDRIVFNSLFKRTFEWQDFNNILLKDGLLTLDFKNNKLLQKQTLDDDEDDATEEEFNAYCKQRLRGR